MKTTPVPIDELIRAVGTMAKVPEVQALPIVSQQAAATDRGATAAD